MPGDNRTDPTRIILTGQRSAFIGPNLIFEAYRTAVATIIVGLDSGVTVSWLEDDYAPDTHHSVVIIPPGTLCELRATGSIAALFCDGLHDDYSGVDLQPIGIKLGELRACLTTGPADQCPASYLDKLFEFLGVVTDNAPRPDIGRVATALGKAPERFAAVDTAAELAGLGTCS